MQRIRYFVIVVLTAAVIIFAMQNLHPVPVAFLVWGFETKVTLVTFVPFLAGLAVGAIAALWWRRRRPSVRPPGSERSERTPETGTTWGHP